MMLAEVIGTVVSNTRADRMESPVYLLVAPCLPDGTGAGGGLVALDIIGAGRGEIVLVSQGSSTRQTGTTVDRPVDALIVGIVDRVDENGRETYRK